MLLGPGGDHVAGLGSQGRSGAELLGHAQGQADAHAHPQTLDILGGAQQGVQAFDRLAEVFGDGLFPVHAMAIPSAVKLSL
jgi:hypothetical protein